jgi:hypothetical protein
MRSDACIWRMHAPPTDTNILLCCCTLLLVQWQPLLVWRHSRVDDSIPNVAN